MLASLVTGIVLAGLPTAWWRFRHAAGARLTPMEQVLMGVGGIVVVAGVTTVVFRRWRASRRP